MTATQPILKECRAAMEKGVEAAKREFSSVRSGKASPNMLDTVRVEMYGQMMAMNQVASVSAPEPRLLVVQPWEKNMVSEISKAIQKSDLGLNPTDDGTVVRVPIPSLTEERRKDMVKLIGKLAEEGRVHIRQVRRDANDELKKRLKAHEIPQDDEKRAEQDIQKVTDKAIGQIDELLAKKTAEIMEV